MITIRFLSIAFFLLSLFSLSCKETIIEYYDSSSSEKPSQNDQYHGDIVGRVIQKESDAMVYIKQVEMIDSVRINPENGAFKFQGVRMGNYDLIIYANNYRTYSRSNVIVPGGGVEYVGDIDLSTVPDLVAFHYPKDEDEIVYDNRFATLAISLLFTQPMDRKSVEDAFSTDPPSTGIFYWGNYIYSPIYSLFMDEMRRYTPVNEGAVITTFSKITALTYVMSRKDSYVDTTYTVTLSTDAHDTAGNHLRFPLVFKFRTVQSAYTVYGIQSSPVDGDIDVSPIFYSSIQVTFPRRMDAVSTEQALSVTPNDDRIVLWPSQNQMSIYMGGVFRADTLYHISIDSTARDLDGNLLGERFSFSFRTAPVRISSTIPRNGEVFVNTAKKIVMYFSTYVLKSSVQNSFSISPQIPGIFMYGFDNNSDVKNVVSFHPSMAMEPNKKYTVTISTFVVDMFGTHMKAPYKFSFITRPD